MVITSTPATGFDIKNSRILSTQCGYAFHIVPTIRKMAIYLLPDLVHRFYQGVLYLPEVLQFHYKRVKVIPFTPYGKYCYPSAELRKNSQMLHVIMCETRMLNYTGIGKLMWSI